MLKLIAIGLAIMLFLGIAGSELKDLVKNYTSNAIASAIESAKENIPSSFKEKAMEALESPKSAAGIIILIIILVLVLKL